VVGITQWLCHFFLCCSFTDRKSCSVIDGTIRERERPGAV
jgi:hypothetical protein